MKRVFVLLAFVSGLLLSACQVAPIEVQGTKVDVPGGSYTDVSVTDLQSMLKNKDFMLVNVHIPYDGDILGTDISIRYDQIDQNLDQLPAAKNAKIVLFWCSDRMSSMAAETLVGLGYANIYNLDGGMVAWEQRGETGF